MRTRLTRRAIVVGGAAALALAAAGRRGSAPRAATAFEITRSEAEWRAMLSPEAYAVLREAATERPFTSPLLEEHRKGTFACAGCALPLFSSETKFESGTGWPSFWQPLENAVATETDRSFGMVRTEVLCRRCGGHLGHVFEGGPPPSCLRYCLNGLALALVPA